VLTVTLQPGSIWDPQLPHRDARQPSEDDAHVPIIFWSWRQSRTYATHEHVDIAPTLGVLLALHRCRSSTAVSAPMRSRPEIRRAEKAIPNQIRRIEELQATSGRWIT